MSWILKETMNKENEFELGQIVTYKPYEEELPAKVTKIENIDIFGHKTEKPRYTLKSTDNPNDKPVIAVTSGLCIKESKFFIDFEEVQLMRRGQIEPFDHQVL